MMPGMDGIETTRRIREIGSDYAKNIPIIALTANAIVGNKEMFLNNGFQSFISKPIEIAHLDNVIREWVRDKDREVLYETEPVVLNQETDKNWRALDKGVPGLTINNGLLRFNGDKAAYIEVLRSFATNTPSLIEASAEVDQDSLKDNATIYHGIRGSSGNISAEEVAGMAVALENAALAGDYKYVSAHNKAFIELVRKLISDISAMIDEFDADNLKQKKEKPDNKTLDKLRQACINYDMISVDAALEELEAFDYESDGELVSWLRESVEKMDFDEIIERLS